MFHDFFFDILSHMIFIRNVIKIRDTEVRFKPLIMSWREGRVCYTVVFSLVKKFYLKGFSFISRSFDGRNLR